MFELANMQRAGGWVPGLHGICGPVLGHKETPRRSALGVCGSVHHRVDDVRGRMRCCGLGKAGHDHLWVPIRAYLLNQFNEIQGQ